jgi:predicted nucleic acid-binding protein
MCLTRLSRCRHGLSPRGPWNFPMIILDTDVVSELMRQTPEDVPDGRRKSVLAARVSELLARDFRDQVLPFDYTAVVHYASIAAARERAGRPISMADSMARVWSRETPRISLIPVSPR